MNVWQFLVRGGVLMVPIAICGILTVAIIIERIVFLQRTEIDSEKFLDEIEKTINAREIKKSISLCDSYSGPVPATIKAVLLKSDRSMEEIKNVIQDEAAYQIPYMEKYLGILATMATVSPLLGFLGTVTGLIKAFMALDAGTGLAYPAGISRGIWEALITTGGGLVVGIPAYIGYNYLVFRINRIVHEMERSASRIMDIMFYFRTGEKEEIS